MFLKGWKKLFLLPAIIIILSGFCYGLYIWNKPERDVTGEKAIPISAVAIFDSFAANENAANAAFLNKAIEVAGKVADVKTNQAGNTVVYIHSDDPMFGVNCTFKQKPEAIAKNDSIVFKGICTGYLSDVILTEGILIAHSHQSR